MEATQVMRFEETELRLGLPGNAAVAAGNGSVRKRGFSETETMDLQLNLSSSSTTATKLDAPPCAAAAAGKLLDASPPPPAADHQNQMEKSLLQADPAKPPAKAQVVGWPPVRSFRKNMVQAAAAVKKSTTTINIAGKEKEAAVSAAESEVATGSFVKVSMDGAPYLRKVDLKMYASYKQLSDALAKMFNSFSTNEAAAAAAGGMKDFMGENNSSAAAGAAAADDYVPTYEDKDGDWMLVGDVPWEMFVVSCKRLRIMKGKDAIIGLAPRGMEKRKNRA